MSRRADSPEFESLLECCRVEDEEVMKLLALVRGDPDWFIPRDCIGEGDWEAAGVLGDLLIDRDDPRGEQIARMAASSDFGAFWPLFGLAPAHRAYLRAFSDTARLRRDPGEAVRLADPVRDAVGLPVGVEGCYFVAGAGCRGEASDASVTATYLTRPPAGQPSRFCGWVPSEDGTALCPSDLTEARSQNHVYLYEKWLTYLVDHFIDPWGYMLNGEVRWEQVDEEGDSVEGQIRLLRNKRC